MTSFISYDFDVSLGIKAILLPWFTTYTIISIAWIIATIKKLGITLLAYLKLLSKPFIGTVLMVSAIQLFSYSRCVLPSDMNLISQLVIKLIIGPSLYLGYLWFFDRSFYYTLRDLRKG